MRFGSNVDPGRIVVVGEDPVVWKGYDKEPARFTQTEIRKAWEGSISRDEHGCLPHSTVALQSLLDYMGYTAAEIEERMTPNLDSERSERAIGGILGPISLWESKVGSHLEDGRWRHVPQARRSNGWLPPHFLAEALIFGTDEEFDSVPWEFLIKCLDKVVSGGTRPEIEVHQSTHLFHTFEPTLGNPNTFRYRCPLSRG